MRVGTNINPIGPFLQLFFAEHMVVHKRASAQTIASYRDTFRLLLQFMQGRTGIPPAALALTAVDADCILDFLNHVEQHRGCSARSRNNRLAAIRTFFRFVSLRDPTSLGMITRIMAIPNKRCEKKLVGFLSRDEVKALIVAPDSRTWSGRRDHALLLTLYNTGGRISEVIGLRRRQVRLDAGSANIQLLGKGRKERVVPLWDETARVLRAWFREFEDIPDAIVFPSARSRPLSRGGADYILRRAVVAATASCPTLANKSVSPHLLRHSTAMHLLQSGVDLAVIALWLGHENIQTTNVYITADLASKERALDKLEPIPGSFSRYRATDLHLRDQIYPNPAKRNSFDVPYDYVTSALSNTRESAQKLAALWNGHQEKVASGEIAKIDAGGNIHIQESVDKDLRSEIETFLNAATRCLKTGMQNIAQELGVKIGFLFQKKDSFERGVAALQATDTNLASYLQQARAWSEPMLKSRIDLEHGTWVLPRTEYAATNGAVKASEPTVAGRPVSEFVDFTFDRLCCFVEEFSSHCLLRRMPGGVTLTEIPLAERVAEVPERFRITLADGGQPAWHIAFHQSRFEKT